MFQLPIALQAAPPVSDRDYCIGVLRRLADPVLENLAQGRLHAVMPVEAMRNNDADRRAYTHLEAFARLLAGMAPWLESGAEAEARRYAQLATSALAHAVDPSSPDYMNFERGAQPLVDAAFLAQALLRGRQELWTRLDRAVQANVVKALRSTRAIRPGFNNWLLFSAMVEAFLCAVGEPWDQMRVDYAIRQHEEWYKGDGVYGDGPSFHWDYYNSFVIQPMLLEVLDAVSAKTNAWESFRRPMLLRAQRYAAVQERLISPEGAYPPIGRSIAYRFGAFHHLAFMAWRKQLPDGISPEQVRCALTAVIRRSIEAPGTFDRNGWLTIGFCGHQPSTGESYISTGSAYLCSLALLPLGLAPTDAFWAGPPKPWTQKRMYAGEDVRADHALMG
jgi:hypothetical protein